MLEKYYSEQDDMAHPKCQAVPEHLPPIVFAVFPTRLLLGPWRLFIGQFSIESGGAFSQRMR